ncbi:glycosyltransferase family 2 protein [Aquibacillus kalidii]|uniref:glycosyltransferase family 2 protein n=1 Tax=Aquibacillus kalidii TaxID=2762597 RepID=UPI001645D526|nr:glycosyltransferase family 2 protein [Aquibacillus kalidii]
MKMNEKPLVSIITVCYNSEELIEGTIKSIMSQTYENIEYIVVDGASKDSTAEIIEEYSDHITHWVSEPDKGIYDAMNKGLSMVSDSSSFVNFMNSGDEFLNNDTIEKVISFAKGQDTLPDVVYGDIIYNNQVRRYPNKLSYLFLSRKTLCHQAVFFKSDKHKQEKYDLEYKIAADFEMILRLKMKRKLHFMKIDLPICEYLEGGLSDTQRDNLYREREKIIKKYPPLNFYNTTISLIKKLK